MRCKACNKQLSDHEAVRKSKTTGEYYDLCSGCYQYVKDALYYNEERNDDKGVDSPE